MNVFLWWGLARVEGLALDDFYRQDLRVIRILEHCAESRTTFILIGVPQWMVKHRAVRKAISWIRGTRFDDENTDFAIRCLAGAIESGGGSLHIVTRILPTMTSFRVDGARAARRFARDARNGLLSLPPSKPEIKPKEDLFVLTLPPSDEDPFSVFQLPGLCIVDNLHVFGATGCDSEYIVFHLFGIMHSEFGLRELEASVAKTISEKGGTMRPFSFFHSSITADGQNILRA